MKNFRFVLFVFVLAVSLIVGGCSGATSEDDQAIAEGVAATQTKQAWEDNLESARKTEEAQLPDPTLEPVIVHVMVPEEPTELSNTYVTDFNSIDFADEGFTYSDQFFINRFERPFTVEMEEYRGYLDLILTNMKVNPPWIYAVIYLAEDLPETSEAIYSLEFDVDLDGRGDFLVQAAMPPDDQWTVAGVQVLEDGDDDVGGPNPVLADSPEEVSSNGFETVLFNAGQGNDPDLAWVRRSSEDPTSLEIALKQSLVGEGGFFWSVWADEGLRNPDFKDYNDRFTFAEAGSPYPEHEFHPIQNINLVDSTCRSWYGLEPVGDELGICQIYTLGEGYKLCYTFNTGDQAVTVCSDVCSPECPPQLPSGYSCQACTMPE
ncbi:MAG: hypothetical protein ACC633_02710 [Anaerolineales bacterium]